MLHFIWNPLSNKIKKSNTCRDKSLTPNPSKHSSPSRNSERGNVFFTLFGAVAVVGVLGAGIMQTMQGPLNTMVQVNLRERAKIEMSIASKLVLLEATSQPSSGDCDADGFVEPLGYTTNIVGLTGGGQLPTGNQQDPWGNDYGYCSWDAGDTTGTCGGAGYANLLDGDAPTGDSDYSVIAIISAGPDGTFQTTCADHPALDTPGGDDLVENYSYDTAVAGTGGLWSIKSGSPTSAEIDKNVDLSAPSVALGGASPQLILGAASVVLPTDATAGMACNSANQNILRVNTGTTPDSLELCLQTSAGPPAVYGWLSVAAGGSASSLADGDTIVGVNDGAPSITFDVDGTTELTITPTTLDAGSLNIDTTGTLAAGASTLGATTITGATGVTGTFDVNGATTLDAVTASGTTTLNGALVATGGATISGGGDPSLTVTGNIGATDLDLSGELNLANTNALNWGDGTVNITGDSTGGNDSLVFAANALTMDGALSITNTGTTDPALNVTGNVDISGDLDVSGGSIISGDNTIGHVLVGDGTSMESVLMSGDTAIAADGSVTIQNNAITAAKILDSVVSEAKLDVSNAAGANECLKFISGSLRWDVCSGSGGGDGVGSEGLTEVLANNNDANATKIANLAEPTLAQDAATKNYVDNALGSLNSDRIQDDDGNTSIDVDTTNDGVTNSIVFTTNGTQRLDINATGTVAVAGAATIGTTLGVTGATTLTDDLIVDTTTLFVDASGNNIGMGIAAPNTSAILDMTSTTAGVLTPRMTIAQRDAITTPATGLIVFSTDAGDAGILQFYDGTNWIDVGAGGAEGGGLWTDLGGDRIHYGTAGTEQVGIGTNNPVTTLDVNGGIRVGSVTGAAAPTYMALNSLSDTDVAAPADGQYLVYNTGSGNWEAQTLSGASIPSGVFDWAQFVDAMTLDATTTIDMDTNTADLNFDADTFVIDSSTNTVQLGTQQDFTGSFADSKIIIRPDNNSNALTFSQNDSSNRYADINFARNTTLQHRIRHYTQDGTSSSALQITAANDRGFMNNGGTIHFNLPVSMGGTFGAFDTNRQSVADVSALLDLQSTTRGFLAPRMTTAQRNAINSGTFATGLMLYNTTDTTYQFWDGANWINMGDTLDSLSCSAGQIARWNGTSWLCSTPSNVDGTLNLTFSAAAVTTGSWSQVGNTLSRAVTNSTRIDVVALTSSRIVYTAVNFTDELVTLDFDGTDWVQVGNALSEGFYGSAALSASRIAAISASNQLRTYDFDGTDWNLVGNAFSLGAIPRDVTQLDSNTVIVGFTNNLLRVYDFDGTDWVQVGTYTDADDIIDNLHTSISTFDNNTILVMDNSTNNLKVLDWTGTTFTQVGNSYDLGVPATPRRAATVLNANTVAVLNGRIQTFNWDGTNFTPVGTTSGIVAANSNAIAALDSSTVVTNGNGVDRFTTSRFASTTSAGSITDNDATGQIGALLSIGNRFTVSGTALNDGLYTVQSVTGSDEVNVLEGLLSEGPVLADIALVEGSDNDLNDINDVDVGTVSDGQCLVYDNTSGNWLAGSCDDAGNTAEWTDDGSGNIYNTDGGSVGIGTAATPDASAILDVASTTAGFLAPRMDTTARDAIGTPATGLMVYNTDNNLYQFYNGTAWTDIGSGAAPSGLEIDDLTDGLKNLTTNNLFLGHEGGADIGANITRNTAIGVNALDSLDNVTSDASTGGFPDGSSGKDNLAIGYNAATNITNGREIIAIGVDALADNNTTDNIAIGINAMKSASGSFNVAIGNRSLFLIGSNSNDNTALGHQTGFYARGTSADNVYIGSRAALGAGNSNALDGVGFNYTGSGNVVIGQSAAAFFDNTGNDYNTIIGFEAAQTMNDGDSAYNIIIGANADVSSATAAHELNIGSLIFGNIDDAATGGVDETQFAVGVADASAIDASAIAEFASTTRGLLAPRMTTAERDLITTPATSLMIFSTTDNQYQFNAGTPAAPNWVPMSGATCTDATPDAFDFTNLSNQAISSLITSNIEQITGVTCAINVTSSGDGSPQIRTCSDAACSTVIDDWTSSAQINNNEYVQTRLTTSAIGGATFNASITAGNGLDTWSVSTLGGDCSVANPPIGTVCADGSVYAGRTPDGNVKMYTSRCDIGDTWNGSACTNSATADKYTWSTNSTLLVGIDNEDTGFANTYALDALVNADSPFNAADICANFGAASEPDALGYTDWYLPAANEMAVVGSNFSSIGNFISTGGSDTQYWTSTESSIATPRAISYRIESQILVTSGSSVKASQYRIRCVRKDGATPPATPPGGNDSEVMFNDGGVLAGNASFVWDNTNDRLGVGTGAPDASSILDLTSTTRGFLPPRMTTTERNAINSGTFATGLTIYNTTTSTLQYYDGAAWQNASAAGGLNIDDLGDAYNSINIDHDGDADATNDDNLALGHEFPALDGTTPGARNIAIGRTALDALTTADDNIVMGYNAGGALTTGSTNIALGINSLAASTVGNANIAIGSNTLERSTGTTRQNVAIGLRASQTTGQTGSASVNNVVIGYQAARTMREIDNSIFVGADSGGNTTALTVNTTVIGAGAGNALDGGDNNLFIGYQTGVTTTTGSNNIVLGYDVDASAATASHELNIGSLIFGNIDDAATGAFNETSVGIGVADATAIELDALLELDSTTRGILLPRMTTVQRDAIDNDTGTTGQQVTTGLTIYNITTNTFDFYNGTAWVSFATTAGSATSLQDADPDTSINVDTAGDGTDNTIVFTNNSAETMRITAAGNVGIGEAAPGNALTVDGDIRGDSLILNGQTGNAPTYIDSATNLDWDNLVNAMTLDASTTIDMDTNSTILNFDSDTFVIRGNTNRIGMGTSTPFTTLHIRDDDESATIQIDGEDTGSSSVNYITSGIGVLGGTGRGWSTFGRGDSFSSVAEREDFAISFYNGTAWSRVMTFDNIALNVGINTLTPQASAALDITSTTQGFLPPRMDTTERDNISSPATGLMVYNTTTNTTDYWNGTAWTSFATSAGSTTAIADADGNTQIQVEETANEDIIRFDIAGTETTTLSATGLASTLPGSFDGFSALISNTLTLSNSHNAAVDRGTSVLFTGSTNINMARMSAVWDAAANTDAHIRFETRASGTLAERMRLSSEGFLGIGNTSPSVELDVTGDIEYSGTMTDVSDRRLKDAITPLNINGALLDRIDQIETVSFVMKDDANKRTEYGVIAQQLETIFPDLVHTAKDEMGTKSVNYMGLIAPMIEATKELKSENDTLRAELAAMKSDQSEIAATLASMKDDMAGMKMHTGFGMEKANIQTLALMFLMMLLGGACVMIVTRIKHKS